MKILNDSQRAQAIERIEKLVNAVEAYDNAKHEDDAERYHSFFTYKSIDLAKELNRKQPETHHTYVAGSLGPMWHPLDDSGPRGYVFFRTCGKIEENPNNLTPEEAGMSKGRCPI
jgi:methionine synthase I (cobalamin-dependent)